MEEATLTRKRRPTLWRLAEQRTLNAESIKRSFIRHIQSSLGRDEYSATALDRYQALCLTVRDNLIERWVNTQQTYYQNDARRVYYISLEYLMGRALNNALVNLGLLSTCKQALDELGYSLEELEDLEVDAGLGNGGLGRLAACFMDSMATLELPGYGYGLRYDYGIFRQDIRNGYQVEAPDEWLRLPYPWEIPRPEYILMIRFGGKVENKTGPDGQIRYQWLNTQNVLAMAYDIPIPGYGNNTVNTLRLWSAKSTHDFNFEEFNTGDYVGAVELKVLSENITRVLYPNDNIYLGQELRLKQEYFLVSATIQDAIRRHLVNHPNLDNLADKVVFQLNDTHPALAIVELMRLLIDDYSYSWSNAWTITSHCFAYTNHTLLPEALEKWPAEMLGRLLPRHLLLINEINFNFLAMVRRRYPGDEALVQRVSIYEEQPVKRVRMANLATIGSFSVNGVAELHTHILENKIMPDFYRLWPQKFNNKTNGITQRRWLLSGNAPLADLISQRIGTRWITQLDELENLIPLGDDLDFLHALAEAKWKAKVRLVNSLRWQYDFDIAPEPLFDMQIKRVHEYKRQLLNILHIIHLYRELQRHPQLLRQPRTFIFAGKAAPGYYMAKLIIKLINDVAQTVNADPHLHGQLKVFFVPNYNVTQAEVLFPAGDISEQISTAGYEASGTGNMKFALNGALTLGTLDGANIEIARAVGADNIFIFGLTAEEVTRHKLAGYNPRAYYERDSAIREVLDLLSSNFFNPKEPGLYRPLVDSLLNKDPYLVLADFEDYRRTHLHVDQAYADRHSWLKKMLLNIAHMGPFSADRTIRDYVRDIWKVKSYSIEVE